MRNIKEGSTFKRDLKEDKGSGGKYEIDKKPNLLNVYKIIKRQ